ncbi:hypothetical protein [Saccharothrix sp. ST-888]|uniref:hypothetical protein n=1 Tax=Saccharothrix sp. ST-888 TaxID=1427391 RepID=UPI0005EC0D05|nr:hypothetical protein [Saccharothrix sp. ST-888]KJK56908.1 hypothetical protein UK12_19720 [Saccharothrix sp. ST-888]
MSYELRALIASVELASVVAAEVRLARAVRLEQELALIPLTAELLGVLDQPEDAVVAGFDFFPGGFGRRLGAWSKAGPIAYVEADYFGGQGSQRGAVWVDGKIELGPLGIVAGEPFPAEGSPISQVLRRLGAHHPYGEDEFEAVGLGRHRHLEGWLGR